MVSVFSRFTGSNGMQRGLSQRIRRMMAGTVAIALTVITNPAWAGDPFRPANPRAIDDQTEAIFRAMFEEGDYVEAQELLDEAETNDPMAHAIQASLAFLGEDWATMSSSATRTLSAAEQLTSTDPLRGNLYTAVGHFLEGAHALMTQGTVQGTPIALQKLQQVFSHMDAAEAIDATDPELNLIKGYMDLMLAVNLPFADPEDAIARLEDYAAPDYVAQRGLAVAYRDLDQPEAAMTAIEAAIAAAPDNPDLFYLKAQVLVQQDSDRDSLEWFIRAMNYHERLPSAIFEQIAWEFCRARARANNNEDRSCHQYAENAAEDPEAFVDNLTE